MKVKKINREILLAYLKIINSKKYSLNAKVFICIEFKSGFYKDAEHKRLRKLSEVSHKIFFNIVVQNQKSILTSNNAATGSPFARKIIIFTIGLSILG